MSGIRDQEQIEALRQRLYERGAKFDVTKPILPPQSPLTPSAPIRTDWQTPLPARAPTTDLRESVTEVAAPLSDPPGPPPSVRTPKRYRMYIILFSLLVFMLGVGTASIYLFFGSNQISALNIGVNVTGPTTVGGGEVLALQFAINNQNPVSLESAILIVRYPGGTRSVEEVPRPLFEDRIPLNTITSGEIRNLTTQAAVFGEENSEHSIDAVLEYRVGGSNSLFERRIDPFVYRISSSPVGLQLSSFPQVAAGQEVPLTLRITSNSPTPLTNLLVRAEYPSTFTYGTADPAPASGQNVWLIESLAPTESVEITVRGTLTGFVNDEYQLQYVVGVPRSPGSFELGGELARVQRGIKIQESNVGVRTTVADSTTFPAIVRSTEPQTIAVTITNTQQQPLREVTIMTSVTGATASQVNLGSVNGVIDAAARTITWQAVGSGDLVVIQPGESRTVSFTAAVPVIPASGSWEAKTEVRAQRDGVSVVIGSTEALVQYAPPLSLAREVTYSTGRFVDSGPVPPEVGVATTYTVSLAITAGANRITAPVLTTSLPLYVSWLDQTDGPGTVEYNPANRQIRWNPGDLEGERTAILSFQIRYIPSAEQFNTAPPLLGVSTLQATDAFTGTLERTTAPVVTTELSAEAGFSPGNGKVVRP